MGNSKKENDISTKNNNSSAKKPQKISTNKKTKSNAVAKARKKETEKKSTKAVYNVKAKKPSATKKETKAPEGYNQLVARQEFTIDALELKPEDITPVEPVDYEELRELIDVANGLNADDYTAKSWAKFEAALEKAIAALSADNQDDVDAAFAELKDAMESLKVKDTETDTESPATEEVLMMLPLFLVIAALVVLFVYVSKKKVYSK